MFSAVPFLTLQPLRTTRLSEINYLLIYLYLSKGIRISKGIGSDKPHIDLKWSQVEKRIAELIKLDRYLNPKEKAQYPEWLQRQEERRAELAEERRKREILSTAPSEKAELKNERYEYHLGSTVYLGANEYEMVGFPHLTRK